MKKFFSYFVAAIFCTTIAFTVTSCSDDDDDNGKEIQYSEVPVTARSFVETHFEESDVLFSKYTGYGYLVKFRNHMEVYFDNAGEWKKIDLNGNTLPPSVLLLLNNGILDYINTNYPNNTIEEIEKKGTNIEVELNNDIELLFNASGSFLSSSGGNKQEELINYNDLPQGIREFVELHFPGRTATKVEKELDKYEIDLNDETEIDFYLDGTLKSVEVENAAGVPDAIIMPAILEYVRTKHSGKVIMEYSKLSAFFTGEYTNGYKTELSGKPELEIFFSKDGKYLSEKYD